MNRINQLFSLILAFALTTVVAYGAQAPFAPDQGGTGLSSATSSDVGKALIVSSTSPFLFRFGTVSGGGGGIAGSGTSTQVAIFAASSTLGSYENFFFNSGAGVLSAGGLAILTGGNIAFSDSNTVIANGTAPSIIDGDLTVSENGYLYVAGSNTSTITGDGTASVIGGALTVSASTTMPTYLTCTLKTNGSGLLLCGTDNTGSGGGATTTIDASGGTATGPAFTFVTSTGSGLWNVTSSGGTVRFVLPSNVGFFSNDAGYLTASAATATIAASGGTATGPALTFVTSTASGVWNVTSSGGTVRWVLPSNLGFFTNDKGFTTYASGGPWSASVFEIQNVASTTGLTFANATGSGNLQTATLKATGAFNASSTADIQGATTLRSSVNIAGPLNASSTLTAEATSTFRGTIIFPALTASRCLRIDANNVVSAATADCPNGDTQAAGGNAATGTPNGVALFDTVNHVTSSVGFTFETSTGVFAAPTGTFTNASISTRLAIPTSTAPAATGQIRANTATENFEYHTGTANRALSSISCSDYFTIQNVTSSMSDVSIHYFDATSTLHSVVAHNVADSGNLLDFNIIWNSSPVIATGSASHAFAANATTTATSTVYRSTTFASSSISAGSSMRWITGPTASTTQASAAVCWRATP